MKGDQILQRLWYERRPRWLLLLLVPLSCLFWVVAVGRRAAYRAGIFRVHRLGRPVVIVGNLTVGGTGKTPFVIWLTQFLQAQGRHVAIALRGYGGNSAHWPRDVYSETPPGEVGDEAVLHATRTGAIVVAGPDRVAAVSRAIERGADIVLCDDGLQHYQLGRDGEIAVMDAQRRLGNRWLLPAGPLREPPSRLRYVDLIVEMNRGTSGSQPLAVSKAQQITVRARLAEVIGLTTGERRALASFRGARVHAVAGIGNPTAFFTGLRDLGLEVVEHAYPDHVVLGHEHVDFNDDAPVLMTEKDAVKCRQLAGPKHWAVRLETDVSAEDTALIGIFIDIVMRTHAGKR